MDVLLADDVLSAPQKFAPPDGAPQPLVITQQQVDAVGAKTPSFTPGFGGEFDGERGGGGAATNSLAMAGVGTVTRCTLSRCQREEA
jgi:hypothetical protein